MPNIQVPPDQIAIFRLTPLSNTGNPRPATGTVTVDRPDLAYVSYNAGGQLVFVTKTIPPTGTTATVTLTANATNSQGVPLTAFSLGFDMAGPVDTDPATHFGITEGPFVRDKIGITLPTDHGQTIPLQ